MKIQKSELTQLAKAIKNIDSSLWHVQRFSDEYELISDARKNLFKIICENGYELQINTYRLIKTKNSQSNSEFIFIENERIEYWYNDDYEGEINESDLEHIAESLEDGIVEGQLVSFGDDKSEHLGWWKIVR